MNDELNRQGLRGGGGVGVGWGRGRREEITLDHYDENLRLLAFFAQIIFSDFICFW